MMESCSIRPVAASTWSHTDLTLLVVIIGACLLSVIISRVITWAASKSPFWNMGFAVVVALAAAGLLVIGLIFTIRYLGL